MSAMDKMLMGAVMGMIPNQHRHHFTEEGIQKLGEQGATIFNWFRGAIVLEHKKLDATLHNQKAILHNQKAIMEALNVGTDYRSGTEPVNGTDVTRAA